MRLIDANAFKKENERLLHCDFPYLSETTLEELIDEAPTIDAVPLSVVRKAAKKLAYIHQHIDLYGDRPDLHDEEYWLEYLMDEEWKDEEID